MATILLSAVGASLGAGFGGTILACRAPSSAARSARRLVGDRPAPAGRGSKAVETGRVDRMRIQTAGEGNPVPRLWGQMRVPGHCIWAAPLVEVRKKQGGGKGSAPSVTNVSYRLSFALALCEGRSWRRPRLGGWRGGGIVDELNMRVYHGMRRNVRPGDLGADGDEAPAHRGIAYVVIET